MYLKLAKYFKSSCLQKAVKVAKTNEADTNNRQAAVLYAYRMPMGADLYDHYIL